MKKSDYTYQIWDGCSGTIYRDGEQFLDVTNEDVDAIRSEEDATILQNKLTDILDKLNA